MKRLFLRFSCSFLILLACIGMAVAQPNCDCDLILNDATGCDGDPTCQDYIDCIKGCEGIPLDNKAWVLLLAGGGFALVKLSRKRMSEVVN